MEEQGRVSMWRVLSRIAACIVVYTAGMIVIELRGPRWWAGALLLAVAAGALVWLGARTASDDDRRGWREILLGRPGMSDEARRKDTLQMWPWHNYPYLIAFTAIMLAAKDLGLLYGFGTALLAMLAVLVPVGACIIAWQIHRAAHRKRRDP